MIAVALTANPARTKKSSFRRSYLSTRMPYRGERSVPVNLSAAYTPSKNGEFVSWSTNHASTTNSICSPNPMKASDTHKYR